MLISAKNKKWECISKNQLVFFVDIHENGMKFQEKRGKKVTKISKKICRYVSLRSRAVKDVTSSVPLPLKL